MDWAFAFGAGVAVGLALLPLARAAVRVPPAAHWVRRAVSSVRFQRVFGVAPSSDPDVRALLQPTIDKHLRYLREQVAHAANDLERLRSERPYSLLQARRSASMVGRTKRRLAKVRKQAADAARLAAFWGFVVEASLWPVGSEGVVLEAPLPVRPRRASRRNRAAAVGPPSSDSTSAAG